MGKCRTLTLAGMIFILAYANVIAGNTQDDPGVRRAVFQVENLTCGACFSKINQALGPIEGFSGMGSNLFRKMVAIDFKAPLTPGIIRETITSLGYPATLAGAVEPLEEKETFAYMQARKSGFSGGGCCGGSGSAPSTCTPPPGSPSNTDI